MAHHPYSIAKHTLLPLLYTVVHPHSLTYLLKDPVTRSLILLPSPQPPQQLQHHIKQIQQQFDCKLTHTFTNDTSTQENFITPRKQGDLRPFLVGELSICYINAKGYSQDYNLVAVTHISPVSTKFAVIFPGKMLSVCSIDFQREVKASQYCDSINKLKYFPNQTLLFPQRKVVLEDLQFAQALEKSSFLDEKIERFKTLGKQAENCLIPTSILQQKMMNPFLSPQKYSSLLKTNDKNACFDILRRMRSQWKQ